jgi:serine phosphatase RsbU (regulator of sigma subunit)/HAMP domain-containing protein
MFRSVKSQIVFTTSLIIIVILGVTAYFVIDQKIKEINQDIFTKSVSFAELTNERIVTNFETNYQQQAFANFDREMADIYSMDKDITGIAIINYSGENLYIAPSIQEHHTAAPTDEDIERIQAVNPSVKIKKTDRVVYLEKIENEVRYTDFNGRDVEPVKNTEQIEDIFYPFRDPNNALRSYSIHYHVSYDALTARVKETATNILVLAIFGIVIALFIGGIVAGRITSPIKKLTDGAKKIGAGDLKNRIAVKSKSEIGMLARTFNKMAEDLEVSTKAMIEKEKMSKELELAGEIQRELLPKKLPKIGNLDIAASLISAEAVGGDCYDFIPLSKDHLLFYIGDVTGHGVPAGLLSAINNALVPAFLDKFKNTKEIIVTLNRLTKDLVLHLNRILKMKTRPNMFMTMVMAIWDDTGNTLEFTQAGHDPIIHFKAADKSVTDLTAKSMALGMIDDLSAIATIQKVPVSAGDVLILYTDGITEAWKDEKDTYGIERFRESIKKNCVLKTAQEIHDGIIKDVKAFMGDYPQADDITLIVAKRTA